MLCALVGCGGGDARTHEERAEELLAAGHFEEALLELRTADQLAPEDARLDLRIADVLRDHGRFDDAIAFYRDARHLMPEDSAIALRLASLLAETDAEESARLADRVLARDPDNARAMLVKAEIARSADDFVPAGSWIERARRIAPEDPEVDWQQARLENTRIERIKRQRGRPRVQSPRTFKAAAEAYARYVQRGGERKLEALRLRAGILALWPGHGEEAAQAYRESMQTALAEGDPWQQLRALEQARAFAHEHPSQSALEREALEAIVQIESHNLIAWQQLAVASVRAGGDAESVYRRMLEAQPGNPRAHVVWARQLSTRSLGDAVAYLRERMDELNEQEQAAELLAGLAELQSDAGRVVDAARTAEELQRRFPQHPATRLVRARLQIERGEAEAAVEILSRLVSEQESMQAQRALARAQYALGRQQQALAAVDRAIELSRGADPEALRLRVRMLFDTQDYERAATALKRLQKGYGLLPSENVTLAVCYYETKRRPLARKLLIGMLETDRPPPEAALEFARREAGARFYRERARRYLEKAYASAPKNLDLLRALTRFDLKSEDHTRALLRLHRAVGRSPRSGALYLLRARTEISLSDFKSARDDAERALALDPRSRDEAIEILALLLSRTRDPKAVVAMFEKRDRETPLSADRRVLLGRLYATLGDTGKALQAYERALAEGSDLVLLKNDLAFLLADRGGDLERAEQLAKQAKNAPGEQIAATDTLGYVYLKQARYEPALWQFRYAVEHAETPHPEYHYHLGLALRGLGRPNEAAAAFDEALEIDADFEAAREARQQLGALEHGPVPASAGAGATEKAGPATP